MNKLIKIDSSPRRASIENTLPMINVVFLLLIFFMLAGAFKRPELFPVNAPVAQGQEDLSKENYLLLIDAQGQMALNADRLEKSELHKAITTLLPELKLQGLQVKADANLAANHLIDVVQILADAGLSKVYLMSQSSASD